eukprot:1443790-Prymnesium_polylepis.1
MASLLATIHANADALGSRRLYTWLGDDGSETATLTYDQLRRRACALCAVLRVRWCVGEGERAMLVHPPGLEFLVAFFACQYAGVVAVPYYPPQISASPVPGEAALRLLADGLAKLARVAESCSPALFLSTKAYLRAKWAAGLVARSAECAWAPSWQWQASDDVGRLSAAEE